MFIGTPAESIVDSLIAKAAGSTRHRALRGTGWLPNPGPYGSPAAKAAAAALRSDFKQYLDGLGAAPLSEMTWQVRFIRNCTVADVIDSTVADVQQVIANLDIYGQLVKALRATGAPPGPGLDGYPCWQRLLVAIQDFVLRNTPVYCFRLLPVGPAGAAGAVNYLCQVLAEEAVLALQHTGHLCEYRFEVDLESWLQPTLRRALTRELETGAAPTWRASGVRIADLRDAVEQRAGHLVHRIDQEFGIAIDSIASASLVDRAMLVVIDLPPDASPGHSNAAYRAVADHTLKAMLKEECKARLVPVPLHACSGAAASRAGRRLRSWLADTFARITPPSGPTWAA